MDYRVYFNRKNEKPQIWSVDEGDQSTEINVCHYMLHQISAQDGGDLSVEPNRDTPTVWIAVLHSLPVRIVNGTAHFFHDQYWRTPSLSLAHRTPEEQEEFNEREVNRRINETP